MQSLFGIWYKTGMKHSLTTLLDIFAQKPQKHFHHCLNSLGSMVENVSPVMKQKPVEYVKIYKADIIASPNQTRIDASHYNIVVWVFSSQFVAPMN